MKKSADYARQVRQLFATLTKRYGKPRALPARDATDELIFAVLARTGPDARALAALESLHRATVDLNDLRVTPVSALAELIGDGHPNPALAAAQVSKVLNAVFARRYTLDLSFIKSMGRRDAERFLSSLAGIHAHDVALFMARFFNMHCVPLDPGGYEFLRHGGLIDARWSHADAQLFLRRILPAAAGRAFYALLKRHAAANPPPVVVAPPPPPVAPAPPPRDPVKQASAPPAKGTPGKPVVGKVASNKTPPASGAAAKPAPGKSVPAKSTGAKAAKHASQPAQKARPAKPGASKAATRRAAHRPAKKNGSARRPANKRRSSARR